MTDKPEVFEPYTGIRFPRVFGDVGRWSEALWERRSLDAMAKGPWSQAVRAETPVIWSATMPGVNFPARLDGPARARAACSHRPMMDVIITLGLMPVVDDATSVLVQIRPITYWWSV